MSRRGLFSLIFICLTFALLGIAISFAKKLGTVEYLIVLSAALIFLLFLVTYVIVHMRKTMGLSRKLIKTLYEDMDTDTYIREINAALLRANSSDMKTMLSIDLATGYALKGDTGKAIEILKRLEKTIKGQPVRIRALYYNNLAFYYFEIGNFQRAIDTFSDGEPYINKQLKKTKRSSSLLDTKAHIEYAKGNILKSEQLLKDAISRPNNGPSLLASVNLLLAKIYIETDRNQEARLLLEYCLSQKLYPIDYNKCKNLLESF